MKKSPVKSFKREQSKKVNKSVDELAEQLERANNEIISLKLMLNKK